MENAGLQGIMSSVLLDTQHYENYGNQSPPPRFLAL